MRMHQAPAVVLVVAACGIAFSQPRGDAGDALIGLWGSEEIVAPVTSGELVIDARGPVPAATIAGRCADVEIAGDSVRFTGGDCARYRKYLRWEIERVPRYLLPAALH